MQKGREAYRTIRPDHNDVHAILQNWVRAIQVRKHFSRCRSIEGRYRPPPMYHEPAPSNPPDLIQADQIELLIREAPHDYGKHLRFWYIRRLSPEMACKKLHIGIGLLEPHLACARGYIKNHLKF